MSGWGVIGIPFGDFPAYSRGRPARHPIADQSLFTRIVTICILVYAAANSGKQDYGGGAVMADTTVEVEADTAAAGRSEEHTSELQSLMRISYAVFCLKKKNTQKTRPTQRQHL